jgi:hypothetical protein
MTMTTERNRATINCGQLDDNSIIWAGTEYEYPFAARFRYLRGMKKERWSRMEETAPRQDASPRTHPGMHPSVLSCGPEVRPPTAPYHGARNVAMINCPSGTACRTINVLAWGFYMGDQAAPGAGRRARGQRYRGGEATPPSMRGAKHSLPGRAVDPRTRA